jgi:RNA polymerase sigma factor (sigma-70 family)
LRSDNLQSKSEMVATVDEVAQAIKKLQRGDLARLNAFAENRARAMRLRGSSFTGSDLLGEAVVSLLEERRHWNPKKVDFVNMLIGAMRSIASNFRNAAEKAGYEIADSQSASPNDDGEPLSPIGLAEAVGKNAEEAAILSDLIRKVEHILADDPEALVIIDGWQDGMSGTEIIEALEMSRTAYETIVRRIRRQVAALWPKRN